MEYCNYIDYLIKSIRRSLEYQVLKSKFKNPNSSEAKSYAQSKEFKNRIDKMLIKNKTYKGIKSEEGKLYHKKYYENHKEAIDNLLQNNKKINDNTVDAEETVIAANTVELPFSKKTTDKFYNKIKDKVTNFIKTQKIIYYITDYSFGVYPKYTETALTLNSLAEFIDNYERNEFKNPIIKGLIYDINYFNNHFYNITVSSCNKDIKPQNRNQFKSIIYDRIADGDYAKNLTDRLTEDFPIRKIIELLKYNPNYSKSINKYTKRTEAILSLKENILKAIPDNYVELYPQARAINRHFVLHIGPTNSGKTYNAIKKLESAQTGAYLAPLRLLAYEQFDSMNKNGIYCSLLTGEESIEVPGATHVASTIEMANMQKYYDVVVIDEAQMINDINRGQAWTKAVLGILADEIHICAAPHAEEILIRLINDCGDTYEVEYTQRQTPLEKESLKHFNFPEDVQESDALIIFSRKEVHSAAAELQKYGFKCSMIYGNLPYDVRHNEAKKFNEGQTQVVVSTDAIGMGLNMPIQRIVFLSNSKFDGKEVRDLLPEEVQQIAGRAGRYGIYDKGYYASVENTKFIDGCVKAQIKPIEEAVITFAPSLIELDVNLSEIMQKWNKLPEKQGYIKADISKQIELCKKIENLTEDKHLIYDLITIPFSEKEDSMELLWLELSKKVINNEKASIEDIKLYYNKFSDLKELEEEYQRCDLYYYFFSRYWKNQESLDYIMNEKEKISELTMSKLDQQAAEFKKCRVCGKPLPWNYRFGLCQKCHNKQKKLYNWY